MKLTLKTNRTRANKAIETLKKCLHSRNAITSITERGQAEAFLLSLSEAVNPDELVELLPPPARKDKTDLENIGIQHLKAQHEKEENPEETIHQEVLKTMTTHFKTNHSKRYLNIIKETIIKFR